MTEDTTVQADVIRLRENIEDLLRRRMLEAVEAVLGKLRTAVLGSDRYERSAGRQGYRNGSERRRITAAIGTRELEGLSGHLLTFFSFPKVMWKSLRTMNSIENLKREFWRRTKMQASFSTEEAALPLLSGLIAFGQIRMRRIDAHQRVWKIIRADALKMAS